MNKTWSQKSAEVNRQWKLIDAKGKPLGRLAGETARFLQGKHKPEFTPHIEGGDSVVIVNSDQVVLTGKKWTDKTYYSHSRHVGSLKEWKARDMTTEDLIKRAVRGMLPKNKLRKRMLKRLRIYRGSEHKQTAQNPVPPP